MGAAQRRRQRRLRSWWRHEQQSIAAALAASLHHSALRGQKKARAGEGAPGQTVCSTCLDRRSGFTGTPWSSLPTVCQSRRRSMLLCCRGVAARLGACSALGSRSLLMLEYGLCSSKPRASGTLLGWTRPGIGQRWRCCGGTRTP